MTALQKMRDLAAVLKESGIDDPAAEAELLLAEALHIDKARLYADNPELPPEVAERLDACASRRARREPLQYLIGHVPFYGLTIHVGPGVLIPRPETELLVESAIRRLTSAPPPRNILDLCSGSGCIALCLARQFPEAAVYAVDRSEAAMVYAVQNARENRIATVQFALGDLFDPVAGLRFDCIVANPPYIRSGELSALQPEIREHEPREALDGGRDGLDFYRRILKGAPGHLTREGVVIMEMGFGQAARIAGLAGEAGFGNSELMKDYAGIERIIIASRGTSGGTVWN